jgi:hypothetical protein
MREMGMRFMHVCCLTYGDALQLEQDAIRR